MGPDPLINNGGYGTATATASVNVGPTPYFIVLYDADSGAVLATCGSGTTCQASVGNLQHVVAFLTGFGQPPASMQAASSSNTIPVNPG